MIVHVYFLREIIELTTMPQPNPRIRAPTKYTADIGNRKNPTPKPIRTPPPIAQVLLSLFSSDMTLHVFLLYLIVYTLCKT
jgi:hypothetical protein